MIAQKGTVATPRLDLGQALEEYPLAATGFVGTDILPIFGTMKKDGQFNVVTRESILRSRDVNRAAGSAYSRDNVETDVLDYACKERGHEQPLDDSQREYYASDFDAEMVSAAAARSILLREQEKRIAALIFDAVTNWPSGTSALCTDVSTDWDNVSSTIVLNVEAAKEQIRKNCGMYPNTMVLSAAHLPNLKANTDIKARFPGVPVMTDSIITANLPALFGIERVLIAGAVYNTANEGQSFSGSDIWSDDYCWLGVCARTNNLSEPCVGRTFLWTSDSPDNTTVEEYREEQTRSWVYRVRHHVDEKVFDPYFGHLLIIDT